METLTAMTITKRIWSPMPLQDMTNVKRKINSILAEALAELKDPDAYATKQMFDHIRNPNKPRKYLFNYDTELYDIEPWDNDD